jgi:hypothetical protein
MRIANRRVERLLACGVVCGASLLLGAGVALADGSGAQVTAVVGDAVTGSGQQLENRSEIADDEKIALGKDGACSVLIDDDALVEMCEETAVVFETDPQSGRRRIRVNGGAIRIVVEPRVVEERIEIHTPAAIATILGTIVHVSVDPVTGETTITSEESRVRVESNDPTVKGSTTVSPLEQISMSPGEAPPDRPRALEPEEVAGLGGCLIDFHAVARNLASDDLQLDAADRIATIEDPDAPWAPSPPPGPAAPAGDPADSLVEPAEVCSAIDCSVGDMSGQQRRILPGDQQFEQVVPGAMMRRF